MDAKNNSLPSSNNYNTNVYFFLYILGIAILFHILKMLNNIKRYKQKWEEHRCSPTVMPFAGIINKPSNMKSSEYTKQNYDYCIKKMSESVLNELEDISIETNNNNKKHNGLLSNMLTKLKDTVNNMENSFSQFFEKLLLFIKHLIDPVNRLFKNLKDVTSKITVMLYVLVNIMATSVKSVKTFLGAFAEFVVSFLNGLTITIAVMFVVAPVTATVLLTLFLVITHNFKKIAKGLTALNVHHKKPKKAKRRHRTCFSGNTKINGIEIKDLEIGDEIGENNYVTAIFRCIQIDNMFSLGNIKVSAYHNVLYKGEYIYVVQHPDAVKIDNYDEENFIYCLGTTTKIININNYTFLDWDEIDDKALKKIETKTNTKFIQRDLIGGLMYDTEVKMNDGTFLKIIDIDAGDILFNNNKVIAIVCIEPQYIYHHYFGLNKYINGSFNIYPTTNKPIFRNNEGQVELLYHIVCQNNSFLVNDNIEIYNYDYALEKYM